MDALLTEAEQVLEQAPFGILLIGQDQHIMFANQQAATLTERGQAELINQSITVLPEWLMAMIKKNMSQSISPDGCKATLTPIADYPGAQACYLMDNRQLKQLESENRILKKRLALLDLYDEDTRLLNNAGLLKEMEVQVSRSRRYANPLTVVSLQVEGHDASDNEKQLWQCLGFYLNDRMRWVDTVARSNERLFVLLLPETDAAAAQILVNKLQQELQQLPLGDGDKTVSVQAKIGIATWEQGDDALRMLERAQENMA